MNQVTSRNNTGNGVQLDSQSGLIASNCSFSSNTATNLLLNRYAYFIASNSTFLNTTLSLKASSAYIGLSSNCLVDCASASNSTGVSLFGGGYLDASGTNAAIIKNCATYGVSADPISGGLVTGVAFSGNGTNIQNDPAAMVH